MTNSLSRKTRYFLKWCNNEKNLKSLLLLGIVILSFMVIAIAFSWLFGYWAGGLYGMKFDLQSCWAGLGAIVTGIGSILTMAGISLGKHYIDSKFNSPIGDSPVSRRNARE